MPALANERHERYARGRAQGLKTAAAYRAAGYTSRKGSGWALNRRPEVLARIEELKSAADELRQYDRMYLIRKLVAIIEAGPGDATAENPLCEKRVVAGKVEYVIPPKLDAIEVLAKILAPPASAAHGKGAPATEKPDKFVQLLEFVRKRK